MQRQLDMQPGKTTLPPHTFPPPRRQDQTGVLLHQRLNSHDCNGDYTVNAPMQLWTQSCKVNSCFALFTGWNPSNNLWYASSNLKPSSTFIFPPWNRSGVPRCSIQIQPFSTVPRGEQTLLQQNGNTKSPMEQAHVNVMILVSNSNDRANRAA